MKNKTVTYIDWGLIDYETGHQQQEAIFNDIIALKLKNRDSLENSPTPNFLLFCEHPHSYTLGRSGHENNLLIDNTELENKNAKFYKIGRGGDITYHGPGQLVGYPIFDLDNFFTDIHKYLRYLEEAIIQVCEDYGLKAGRIDGLTGVWIDYETPESARKICAMGVKASRWVTMHGFALNVNTDLSYFQNIVPCGITDKAVTSLEKEVGKTVEMEEVKNLLKEKLATLFELEYL